MIAIQKIGKSFMGALRYNLKKLFHSDRAQRAELLDSNFASMELKLIQEELNLVKGLRPNLGRYVYHTSLNFSKEDKLDNDTLLAIALDYLTVSGYTNNQYIIFRHHDAGHTHIHLLVNRITFDGGVVSDSNNYKKSEAILRKLEQRYNLVPVDGYSPVAKAQDTYPAINPYSSISLSPDTDIPNERRGYRSISQGISRSQTAPTKDELEMVLRTGKPSDKMVLQELMKRLFNENLSLQDLIKKGERQGIHFLFNQATTGRISGITYFYEGFKIKGQALGNAFKWSELIKQIDYEQTRDSQTISEANDRTRAKYGAEPAAGRGESVGGSGLVPGNPEADGRGLDRRKGASGELGYPGGTVKDGEQVDSTRTSERGADADLVANGTASPGYGNPFDFNIEIADDEDDSWRRKRARYHGR